MDFRLLKKEIKRNIVGFVTIVLLTMLGVGFLSGLFSCVPDIKRTVNDYYETTSFHDIRITSSLGFTEDDIREIGALDYIDKYQPVYSLYSLSSVNGSGKYVTYVRSVDMTTLEANPAAIIDSPVLIDGSYPTTPKSCLVVKSNAMDVNIQIGDRLALLTNTDNCTENTFTVTGFVNTPEFTSNIKEDAPIGNGKTEIAIYVSKEMFTGDAFYSEVLCKLKSTEKVSTFDKKYNTLVREAKAKLEDFGKQRAAEFIATISGQYKDDLNKAQKHYEYIKGQTEDELKTLSQNIAALEKSVAELEAKAQKEEADVLRLKIELETLKPETPGESTEGVEDAAEPTESEPTAEPPAEDTPYEAALKLFNEANELLETDKKDLQTNQNTLASLKAEYAILEGLAGKKVGNAEKTVEDLNGGQEDYSQRWAVMTRDENLSYNSFLLNAQKINTISGFFPVIFFIVSVCLVITIITRMVLDQRHEIGLLQTLGYSDQAIMLKYGVYALLSTVLGSVAGTVIGVIGIPKLLFKTYSVFYNFPEVKVLFLPHIVLASILIEAVLVLGFSLYSCWRLIKGSPAELLQPLPAPKPGRIFLQNNKLWQKIGTNTKIRLKNVFYYKSRLIPLLVGIIGCTALILSCTGLNNSIGTLTQKQYALHPFDAQIYLTENAETDNSGIKEFTDNKDLVSDYIRVRQSSVNVVLGDKADAATAVVLDNDKINEYYKLKTNFGKNLKTDENSVILSRNFADSVGIKKGDQIKISTANGEATLTVTNLNLNYMGNYVFLGKAAYAKLAGGMPEALLIKNGKSGYNKGEIVSKLLSTGQVSSVTFTADSLSVFGNTAEKITELLTSLIVFAIILCAASVVITFVLNFRQRGESTERAINSGVTAKQLVKGFLFENAVITAVGIIVGIILGAVLHTAVVSLSNMTDVMLVKSIGVWPFILALIIPAVLTFAASIAVYPFIKKK